MNKVLWVISLKAKILERSPLDMDGSEFTFGEAATFSHSAPDVKEQLLQKMKDGKLELIEQVKFRGNLLSGYLDHQNYYEFKILFKLREGIWLR